jgi:hypothetical protein
MGKAMTASTRSFGGVLWSLLLAMINATLILVALCLWLGWHVLSETRAITDRVADSIPRLTPVKDEIAGLRAEVTGLRSDLAGLQGQPEGASPVVAGLGERLDQLEGRLAATGDRIDAMTSDPGALIDRAVDRLALQVKSGLAACMPSGG